jgi:hypothetical protein
MEKEVEFQIGTFKNPIIIKLTNFENRNLVDIRKYYIKNEVPAPTKKGIMLNLIQLSQMLEVFEKNEELFSKFLSNSNEFKFPDSKFKLIKKTLVGRKFNIENKGADESFFVDEEFSKKFTENELKIIIKMISIFYNILNSNIELDDSEHILNIIDFKLSTLS